MRRSSLIDIDRVALAERMRVYYDPKVDWASLKALKIGLTEEAGRFDPKSCRERVLKAEGFDDRRIMRYALYPFDVRWCYYSSVRPLWNEPRPALAAQMWPGNKFIITRVMAERPKEQIAITIASELPDYHLLRPNAIAIPICLRPANLDKGKKEKFKHPTLLEEPEGEEQTPTANLSPTTLTYLAALGITNPDADPDTAALIWMHALAVGYTPAYLRRTPTAFARIGPEFPCRIPPTPCEPLPV